MNIKESIKNCLIEIKNNLIINMKVYTLKDLK